jgi:hypothetical protein
VEVDGKVEKLIVVEGGTKGMEGMEGDETKTAKGIGPNNLEGNFTSRSSDRITMPTALFRIAML